MLRVGEGGCGGTLQEPRNKGPVMPLQHANRLFFSVASPIEVLFIFFSISMHFSLYGAPVASASRLPGVELAVLLLLLAPKFGQEQSNYRLAHEEL